MHRILVEVHDSPLGRWTRALCFLAPPLDRHVAMLWYVAGTADYARDRRLPNGQAHLLFNLASPPSLLSRDGTERDREFPTSWPASNPDTWRRHRAVTSRSPACSSAAPEPMRWCASRNTNWPIA